MATYAIGDVQGCYAALLRLLELIRFDPAEDTLWFVGDLVNRGPESLATLRLVHSLGDAAITVLGNHDLHLLAIFYAGFPTKPGDTLDDVLSAPDRGPLLDWLRCRPLLHRDDELGFVMVHAGLPHIWTLAQAERRAREVETALRGGDYERYFRKMYGNKPRRWKSGLRGRKRLRVITNYLTRMRFIDERGRLDLDYKGAPSGGDVEVGVPWFDLYRTHPELQIIFGHWAALDGQVDVAGIHALDTGYVWGNALTALCLETLERTSVEPV